MIAQTGRPSAHPFTPLSWVARVTVGPGKIPEAGGQGPEDRALMDIVGLLGAAWRNWHSVPQLGVRTLSPAREPLRAGKVAEIQADRLLLQTAIPDPGIPMCPLFASHGSCKFAGDVPALD